MNANQEQLENIKDAFNDFCLNFEQANQAISITKQSTCFK